MIQLIQIWQDNEDGMAHENAVVMGTFKQFT